MTCVPGTGPVRVLERPRRLAVTASAERIQLGCRQPLGILDRIPRAIRLHVRRARPVTRLTPHPEFEWQYLLTGTERERTRRVALEAAQDIGLRIEGAVSNSGGIGVARCQRHRFRLGVVTQPMLDIPVL